MSELGQILKKARLERKISLEDLQETTKIRKRYLEAIEEGNYKILPGAFYVRAFIKTYSEAVGLDPTEVLQMYKSVNPGPAVEHVEPVRSKRTSRNTEKIGRWASTVMMIAFVVLIMGIIYYYINTTYSGDQTDANPNEEPTRVTDKIEPAPAADITDATYSAPQPDTQAAPAPAPVTAPAAEVKLVKSQGGKDFYTVKNADKLMIQAKVTGEACWISVHSLGAKKERLAYGSFDHGVTQTWEVPATADMNFGRANAVELTVNGTVINLGTEANPKRVQFDLIKA
ncbi:helix-turn-helix domain-containing protein [Paenibacillus xerothermodurans]|uniref:DUF4115 domain-containing protein n=1 Tax=Paenibacillus xerothermodurans TaxID=1977292 RepID=A0A2W1NXD7_PAEXE|nr:RodZ domain-containing protein [Paenibacillus xerothermodurans]PZE22386.1 DUF4115 domain-containing protein [Paenibacillus xerothermodurans]